MVLAWHTNITSRWLDPQQHDGTASPDNFLMALHDALDQKLPRGPLRPSGACRRLRFCRRRQERDLPPATRDQIPRRHAGHARGCQMELRALPRRLGRSAPREDPRGRDRRRPHGPLSLQRPVPRFPDPARHRQCQRRRLGRSRQILREGRTGRVSAEADRRRALQARLAATWSSARIRGFRRLLPSGARQTVHDGQRAGSSDARRDARARRSRHHVFRARGADRPGQEQSQADAWHRWSQAIGGSSFPVFRIPRTRSTTSVCARRSASRSTATRSTRPNATGWDRSTATGSTTTSNTACSGPNGSTTSPRPSS